MNASGLDHRTHRMCRRIIRGQHDDPANGVIEHAGAQAEPRSVRRQLQIPDDRGADGTGQAVHAREHRADGQRNRAGFPEGDGKRSGIQADRSQRAPRKGKDRGSMKPIAYKPTADAQARHQGKKPDGQPAGRLLQIGFYREISKQKAGEYDEQLQNRTQNILHLMRSLCSRNSINACRAGFKSS